MSKQLKKVHPSKLHPGDIVPQTGGTQLHIKAVEQEGKRWRVTVAGRDKPIYADTHTTMSVLR
jgi:hypothetical protein